MGHETEVHCMIRNRYMEREKILKNRAGSLNHVSGEPDRGEPGRFGSPLSGSPLKCKRSSSGQNCK